MKIKIIDQSNSEDINNFYRPSSKYVPESFDAVDLKNCFDKTNINFLPIVLKEWFFLLKVKGTLKIFYSPKFFGIDPLYLEKTLWWLFEKKYKILSHDYQKESAILSLTKEISILRKDDGIDHWSFGMVTNGVRKDFIEKSIKSIRNLKIPNYEIIICGNYAGEKSKDIKYIEFRERDDRGWITRKKNIIAKNAAYSNLCIFHDRIVFDRDWYDGMKKFGNNFEVIGCVQKLSNGERAGDWFSLGTKFNDSGFMYKMEQLDYKDWDRYVYISGQITLIKKYIWEEVSWNETIYWQEGEDIEYSSRLTERGYIPRFNPFSSCLTLSWRFGKLPSRGLHDVPLRRLVRLISYYFIKIPKTDLIIRFLYPIIQKSPLYKIISNY